MSGDPSQPQTRLYVLMAREAPTAVIVRRARKGQWQLVLWDTQNDEFTPGQWIKGKVIVDWSDISADGRYVLLGLEKDRYGSGSKTGGPHTVISRPPYFSAVAYFPSHWNLRQGGSFREDGKVGLYMGKWIEGRRVQDGCPFEFFMDLAGPKSKDLWERRGWTVEYNDSAVRPYPFFGLVRLIRRLFGRWVLGKSEPETPRQSARVETEAFWEVDEYRLELTVSWEGWSEKRKYRLLVMGKEVLLGDVTWVGFNKHGRCLAAREGRIFVVEYESDEVVEHQLVELTKATFEKVAPPDWALEW